MREQKTFKKYEQNVNPAWHKCCQASEELETSEDHITGRALGDIYDSFLGKLSRR